MKKEFSRIGLFIIGMALIWACQDHLTGPGTGTGTTGPGSGTGTTGPGSGSGTLGNLGSYMVSVANSSTVTAVMSSTTSTNTSCASLTGLAKVVCLAQAFEATLTATQLATVQRAYSTTDAAKWSNLPQYLYQNRVGINLASLNATQLAAFRNLMLAVLVPNVPNEGYMELFGNLVADNYLAHVGGGTGFGAGNFYTAFLGTPSTTGLWELQYGGHHYTFANTYNAGAISGWTPSFRGVEPMAAVTDSATGGVYQPVEQERVAFSNVLTGLSSTELATAKLPTVYTDILLGPGVDWQFPTTKAGLRVGNLSSDKQTLVLNAIKLYVNDLDPTTAATILALYSAGLADTYISYSGTTSMSALYDYIRVDGPRIWIEYSSQGGIVVQGVPHPHSVWRDRTSDYGGNR